MKRDFKVKWASILENLSNVWAKFWVTESKNNQAIKKLKSDYAALSNCNIIFSSFLNEKILKNKDIHSYYKQKKQEMVLILNLKASTVVIHILKASTAVINIAKIRFDTGSGNLIIEPKNSNKENRYQYIARKSISINNIWT